MSAVKLIFIAYFALMGAGTAVLDALLLGKIISSIAPWDTLVWSLLLGGIGIPVCLLMSFATFAVWADR